MASLYMQGSTKQLMMCKYRAWEAAWWCTQTINLKQFVFVYVALDFTHLDAVLDDGCCCSDDFIMV